MILAIVQARMNSTRLPGKVLMPIAERPMVIRVFERLQQSILIDKVIVATSDQPQDDALINELEKWYWFDKYDIFRGPLDDVLDRYYQAACHYGADIIVRITGDCPLIDPYEVNKAIKRFIDRKVDYLTNNNREGKAASGFDIEVFSFDALAIAHKQATGEEREHVMAKWIENNPEALKVGYFLFPAWCYQKHLSVDDDIDYQLVNRVFTALYENNPVFSVEDIRKYLGVARE
jgi:spore coat polysaccharide biosynthesis protein SpsF